MSHLFKLRSSVLSALLIAGLPLAAQALDNYSTGPGQGATDTMDDVWQGLFNGWGLTASADEDNDGCSNFIESVAGTDPRNASDCIAVGNTAITGSNIVLTFRSQAGKRYRVLSDTNPGGTFTTVENISAPVTGTSFLASIDNTSQTLTVARTGVRRFYRVEVADVDSDGDGASDWDERKMGTNIAVASSTGNGAQDGETIRSYTSLVATPTVLNGYEKNDKTATTPVVVPAKIGLTRSYGTMALNNLSLVGSGGAPTPQKSNATLTTDYTIPSTVSIPTNGGVGTPFEFNITPVQDSSDEVPEYAKVTVKLTSGSTANISATVCVCDADPSLAANNQLYVAYLGHEAGQATTASGYAIALMNGDNTAASVSVVFSNLSSTQNTAYIRFGQNNDLAPALPTGQVTGFNYNVVYKPGFLNSDQAFLTALIGGQLGCAVTSANFTAKEIFGYFNRATGSTTFDPNSPTLTAPNFNTTNWSTSTNEQIERDIWRFMTQSTFGGTTAIYNQIKAKVDARMALPGGTYLQGLGDWLDEQMNPALTPTINYRNLVMSADNEDFALRGNKPITFNNDPQFNGTVYGVTYGADGKPIFATTADNNAPNNNFPNGSPNRRREWWGMVMQAKDQVRQRMTQALHEIIVVSEADQTTLDNHYGTANYWDMIAQGAFGKYRDLLEDVTYNPIMGSYLSHVGNRMSYDAGGGVIVSPDENYAREIMQLFSIGLVLRHPDGSLVLDTAGLPIPTYDQTDITELARVMTGFSHGARHAQGYVSNWDSISLTYNTSANARVSDLILLNGSSAANTWFGQADGHLYWQARWTYPMKVIGRIGSTQYHDFAAKTLLNGKAGQATIPAQTITSMTDAQTHTAADTDLRLAHNALAGDSTLSTYNGHQNTPVNMVRWLIQRLVTSNPSAGYIYRVRQVYNSSNGNLGQVLKAILLDYEARSLQFADSSISHGKVKEPLIAFASTLRAFNAFSGAPVSTLKDNPPPFSATDAPMPSAYPQGEFDKFSTDNANPPSLPNGWATGPFRYRFGDLTGFIGQSPQRAPSVFNWFLPDYVEPGPLSEAGLFAPELQINTEASVVAKINAHYTYTWSNLVGMDPQPGSDSQISNFTMNQYATPAVRFSLDGGQTFISSFTFDSTNWNTPRTLTAVGVDTESNKDLNNNLLRFGISGTGSGYENVTANPIEISKQDDEEPNESIWALHTAYRTTVQEGGNMDTITVRLASQPPSGKTVTVNMAAASGQVTLSNASFTFNSSNWNTNQTLTVTAVDDSTTETNGSANDTVNFTSSSSVSSFNGLSASLPVAVIDNDDGANSYGVLITESGSSTTVGETTNTSGSSTDSYTVVLTKQPTANVTLTITPNSTQVAVNTTNGGTTFSTSAVTRTFTTANWNTAQTVVVRGSTDNTAEGTFPANPLHYAVLNHSASGGGYAAATPVPSVTVGINDIDNRIILAHTNGETRVQEGGNTDTVDVSLRTAPTVDVVVNLGSNTVRCTPANLTFTPANYNVIQTVTVSAVDDATSQGLRRGSYANVLPVRATATATLTSGAVTAANITNVGAGYVGVPPVTFGAAPSGGTTATGFARINANGTLAAIVITNGGSGYTSTPSVSVGSAGPPSTLPPLASTVIVASGTSEGIADANYNNYWSATHSGLHVTVLDNDDAEVVITASGGFTSVTEGGNTDDLSLALSRQPTADVTVTLNPANTQISVSPSTFTFTSANWNTPQVATVTAANDASVEGNSASNVILRVSSDDKAYDGNDVLPVQVTILDNDRVPLTVTQTNAITTVSEGGTVGAGGTPNLSDTFQVLLPRAPTAPVTVNLITDGQVTVSPTSLSFTTSTTGAGAYNANQTVTVTAVNDATAELTSHLSNIRFQIISSDPVFNGPVNLPVVVQIKDNDSPGVSIVESSGSTAMNEAGTDSYTVVLTQEPASDVVVSVASPSAADLLVNSAATSQLTFTKNNWSSAQTVNVSAVDDLVTEGRELHSISHSIVTGSSDPAYAAVPSQTVFSFVGDVQRRNESIIIVPTGGSVIRGGALPSSGTNWVAEGEGFTDSVAISLSTRPANDVFITLNSTGQVTTSVNTLLFTPTNWNLPQIVSFAALDDLVVEANHTVSTVSTTVSGDTLFNGLNPSITFNIVDNDSPAVLISNTGGSLNTAEGGATDSYSVVLTKEPNGNVVISITGTSDSTLSTPSLTFNATNWNVPQVVTVTATNDTTNEGPEVLDITHAINAGGTTDTTGYAAVTGIQLVRNNVTDNDDLIFVSPTGDDTRVFEDGTYSDTYTVVLKSAPTASVTVNATVSGTNQGLSLSTSSVTFTTINWSVPQTITVSGVNNSVQDKARTVNVTHASSSTDANFNNRTTSAIAVSVIAIDTPQLLVYETSGTTLSESGVTDTYLVALSEAPTGNVTVAINNDTEQTVFGGANTLTFTPSNWNVFQTVTLIAVDDDTVETNPHFGLTTNVTTSSDVRFNGLTVTVPTIVNDNDAASVLITANSQTSATTEGGNTGSYQVVLSHVPSANVTVNVAGDADATASPSSLTFTAGNWSTPQTVTITAVNDTDVEGNHVAAITHSVSSADLGYHLVPTARALSNVSDNDGAQLVVDQSGGTTAVTEGTSSDTINFSLSQAPTATVTVLLIPPMYIVPPPPYAKQVGYYTGDNSNTNQNKERVVMDYTELILLYRTSFYGHLATVYGGAASIPVQPSDLNLQNAHWAATKALIDKTDLWFTGGRLKALHPVLIEPNQALPSPAPATNPRQVIMDCIYQINAGTGSPGTTRYLPDSTFDPKNPPSTTFHNEVRDRVRWVGYLMTTIMNGYVQH